MSKPDARVVAHYWTDACGKRVVEFGRKPPYSDAIPLTDFSLLAEAEELAERNRNHWHTMKAERDALQARLDGVLGWAAEVENYLAERSDVIDGDYGNEAPNEEMKLLQELTDLRTGNRSAALGGESPGNDEVSK